MIARLSAERGALQTQLRQQSVRLCGCLSYDLDSGGFFAAETQVIAADEDIERIAQGAQRMA